MKQNHLIQSFISLLLTNLLIMIQIVIVLILIISIIKQGLFEPLPLFALIFTFLSMLIKLSLNIKTQNLVLQSYLIIQLILFNESCYRLYPQQVESFSFLILLMSQQINKQKLPHQNIHKLIYYSIITYIFIRIQISSLAALELFVFTMMMILLFICPYFVKKQNIQNQLPSPTIQFPPATVTYREQFHDFEEKEQQQTVLNVLPEGILILDEKKDVKYINSNIIQLFQAKDRTQILRKISEMIDLEIVEPDISKPIDQPAKTTFSSYSSYKPYYGSKIKKNTIRQQKRAKTNLNTVSAELTLKKRNSEAEKQQKGEELQTDNIFYNEIEALVSELNLPEHIKLLKNNSNAILQNILTGYVQYQKEKRRSIELKLYSILINSQSLILIMARDVSYRDYIRLIRKYSHQKSSTLNFVSHEFRTPLNCIISMLEASQDDTSKAKKFVSIAKDNSCYLLSLTNDLLDLAQIKVGKFFVQNRIFNLLELIQNCLEMFQVVAERHKIRLYFSYNCQAEVYSDSKRIKQILINLLGNAFKFTIQGEIGIEVTSANQGYVQILVKDTGVGISEKDQLTLFKAFSKGNSDEHKKLNETGVGLGLLISNLILQNMNEDIQNGLKFTSILNQGNKNQFHNLQQGTQFYFQIKTKYPSVENIILEKSFESEALFDDQKPQQVYISQVSKMSIQKEWKTLITGSFENHQLSLNCNRILIIDDDKFNIEALSIKLEKRFSKNINIYFRKCGIVDFAISGDMAIKKIQAQKESQNQYKLIFLDLEMPGMDGFQTFAKLNEILNDEVNIVGCSGYSANQQRSKCLLLGMKDYLEKPINNNQLEEILAKYYF